MVKNLLKTVPSLYRLLALLKFDLMRGYDSLGQKEIPLFRNVNSLSPREMRLIKRDILDSLIRYGTTPLEYFLFGFPTISKRERASFLTDFHREELLIKIEGQNAKQVLDNKFGFYEICKEYFKRQCLFIPVGGGNSLEFIEFALANKRVFIKPNCDSCGRKSNLFCINDEKDADVLYKRLVESNIDWIVEEAIDQNTTMSSWNSSSVNTIRVPSILTSDGVHLMTPSFRVGRYGSVVDNAGSGGILANVDVKNGRVISEGVDELGHTFSCHPDSGITFKNWQIPEWEELLLIVETLHKSTLRSNKYIGFDFALSNKGWCLIEGNWGQMINQYADKRGRKEEFELYMKYDYNH